MHAHVVVQCAFGITSVFDAHLVESRRVQHESGLNRILVWTGLKAQEC